MQGKQRIFLKIAFNIGTLTNHSHNKGRCLRLRKKQNQLCKPI